MRYINLLILTLFFYMIPLYANEIVVDGCTVYFGSLTNKQKDEIIGLRENLLIKSNDIKKQLKIIRMRIQEEMRKESPDWVYMDELNESFFRLQNQLTNELIKYKKQLEKITYEEYGQLNEAD
ncbi:hypothetical protein [uncultured Fusobacterium sp.]|uniref:hypothetical protein n=1 Tax=uncultured Fusobacterium sp. TaxID=159267 RepID=UPI0025CB9001|nr:hypothetical protein [uncultured Fusobacterium sp.]